MGIETAILDIVLKAPLFIEGVRGLIQGFLNEGTSEGPSDALTIDEVSELVMQRITGKFELDEKKILSKVQSMLDKGFQKFTQVMAEKLDPSQYTAPTSTPPAPPDAKEDVEPEPIIKIRRAGRNTQERR